MLGCKIIYGTVNALFYYFYSDFAVVHYTAQFVAPVGAQKM
jgi:hypothetical protein